MGIIHQIVDLILPPRCVITGEIVDRPGMLSSTSWKDLQFIDAPFCARCGQPFDFETEADMMCGGCIDEPPEFDIARSALVYNDTSRGLILAFKHGDRLQLVRSFTGWLNRAGQDILTETDIVVPVPLHRKRLWSRRYNQSAILARHLAKHNADITYAPSLIQRTRATPPQKGLTRKERAENMRAAFLVDIQDDLAGKSITLIDDVYTSGATLNACANALKKAGAKQVFALTIARVLMT